MKSVVQAVILGMVMTAWTAVHAGNNNIRWTAHNMSNNTDAGSGLTQGQRHFVSLGVDQVCIFCHTPHHSEPAKPLWNKVMPTQAFNVHLVGNLDEHGQGGDRAGTRVPALPLLP